MAVSLAPRYILLTAAFSPKQSTEFWYKLSVLHILYFAANIS